MGRRRLEIWRTNQLFENYLRLRISHFWSDSDQLKQTGLGSTESPPGLLLVEAELEPTSPLSLSYLVWIGSN